jgi:hypothetical protein
MSDVSINATSPRALSPGAAIAIATLVAGTLDISYAIVSSAMHGVAPIVIWQSVASGALGKSSYEGGLATAVLGGAFHYSIMACFALTYYLLSRRWPQLVERPFLYGPLYGVGVFIVMNYAVVPLSAIGHTFHRDALHFAGEMGSHLFFVGLPIAWFASRTARPERAAGAATT